jgi:hypothetical protein
VLSACWWWYVGVWCVEIVGSFRNTFLKKADGNWLKHDISYRQKKHSRKLKKLALAKTKKYENKTVEFGSIFGERMESNHQQIHS